MADIGAAGGALVAAGWSAQRLLGPLFDEIAEGWREQYSTRRLRNLNKIGKVAQARVEQNHLAGDGRWTSPRVASEVLEKGSWCDASVMSEYFGGILASSMSPEGLDDRGLSWATTIAQMPTRDVWLHYQVYSAVRRLFLGQDWDISWRRLQQLCVVYLPLSRIDQHLVSYGDEAIDVYREIGFSHTNLQRLGLMAAGGCVATLEDFATEKGLVVPEAGFMAIPSTPGIELFLWAHGYSGAAWRDLLDPSVKFEAVEEIPMVEGVLDAATLPRAT